MNYLKVQLHLFTEKQREMNFFIRLRFALKAALTNFQNIFDKKENLITLTTKLKINIKRYDNVITTFNDRLNNFKNVRRKFFKHKKKTMLSVQLKNLSTKIKNRKKKQDQFLKLLVITANKRNIMRLSVSMFLKMLK